MQVQAFKARIQDSFFSEQAKLLGECVSADDCITWKFNLRGTLADILVEGEGQPQDESASFCAYTLKRAAEIR